MKTQTIPPFYNLVFIKRLITLQYRIIIKIFEGEKMWKNLISQKPKQK